VPILTLIAGPNGAGKSTLSRWLDFEGRDRLLDPDAVARELDPDNPQSVAVAAGREVAKRIRGCFSAGISFAVETTLSGRTRLRLIREAQRRGYRVHLAFIGLDTAERCVARIQTRAMVGGHFIPASDVRRRYRRSMAHLHAALALADLAKVYDNSGDGHRLVLFTERGIVRWRAEHMPPWAERPPL
jgi:predicted ABC-type ATPase